MGKFGWSYPPGAAGDPYAPYNQKEGPCEVCGNFVEDCICPECPVCGAHGDPTCYVWSHAGEMRLGHGLRPTHQQILCKAWRDALEEAAARDEAAYWAIHPGADEF